MLHCRTLGTFELRGSTTEERLAVLSQPKRAALLVYLAVAKPRGFHRRDTLLALFWPDSDGEHARAALRQALTFLRRELGDAVVRTRNAADLAVDPERLWCDAAAFEDAVNGDELERALDLYQGDFLPGFHVSGCGEFERWLEQRRAGALHQQCRSARARVSGPADAPGGARWSRWCPLRSSARFSCCAPLPRHWALPRRHSTARPSPCCPSKT